MDCGVNISTQLGQLSGSAAVGYQRRRSCCDSQDSALRSMITSVQMGCGDQLASLESGPQAGSVNDSVENVLDEDKPHGPRCLRVGNLFSIFRYTEKDGKPRKFPHYEVVPIRQ